MISINKILSSFQQHSANFAILPIFKSWQCHFVLVYCCLRLRGLTTSGINIYKALSLAQQLFSVVAPCFTIVSNITSSPIYNVWPTSVSCNTMEIQSLDNAKAMRLNKLQVAQISLLALAFCTSSNHFINYLFNPG